MTKNSAFIPNKWVYKIKLDKYIGRLVLKGFMEKNSGDTFSPTLKLVILRLIFALTAVLGFDMLQMDVCNAFVNAKAPSTHAIYTNCPQGYEREGWVLRLEKALYGLKGSPRAWFEHILNYFESLGLEQSKLDPCLFTLKDKQGHLVMILGLYVDDLIIGGQSQVISWFKEAISNEFLMEDLGTPTRVVGIDVTVINGQLHTAQTTKLY